MERRKFLRNSIFFSLTTGTLISCTSNEDFKSKLSDTEISEGTIVHQVYFWLKEDLSKEDELQFIEFVKILKTVPGVLSLQLGKPAATNTRPVVDNSFSYSIMVSFKSMEDINVYETHPIHLDAVEKYKYLWTKVQVKDSVIQEI